MNAIKNNLLIYSQLILGTMITVIIYMLLSSISVYAAPYDYAYASDIDAEPIYIESRDTSFSDITPGQVSFSALFPDGFGLSAFSIIENTQTKQLYRCIFYATNDYKDTIFLPVGTYEVIECSVFDDTTAKYKLSIPEEFTIDPVDNVIEVSTELVDFDSVNEQIKNNNSKINSSADKEVLSFDHDSVSFVEPNSNDFATTTQPESDFEVIHTGTGTGYIAITGKQLAEFDKLIIKIINSGNIPDVSVIYSLDNGVTWSDIYTIPLSGYLRLPNTGLTAEFFYDSDTDLAFIAGDIYSAYIPDPKEHILISQGSASLATLSIESIKPELHVFDILEQLGKKIVVAVTKSGNFGSSVIRISIDGGENIYKEMYVPVDGTIFIPELGINLIFSSNTDNQKNFSEGDVFIVSTKKESNTILIFVAVLISLISFCGYCLTKRYFLSMVESQNSYKLFRYTRYKEE